MAEIYADLVEKGLRTLDQIKPESMRKKVKEILEQRKKNEVAE